MKRASIPPDSVFEQAQAASTRVHHRAAPIRRYFIRSQGDEAPPLAEMLRGGRGGGVRIKLLLSALWISAGDPFDTEFPAGAWAQLLGLDDPFGRGARRITAAIAWLERRRFIEVERLAGRPSRLTLLDEAGSGAPYQHPSDLSGGYLQLDPAFWTQQWVSALSGAGVALLLIQLELKRRPSNKKKPPWVSPAVAKARYALSPDTWTKGNKELQEHGLLSVSRLPVDKVGFAWKRVRNGYTLKTDRLKAGPNWSQ